MVAVAIYVGSLHLYPGFDCTPVAALFWVDHLEREAHQKTNREKGCDTYVARGNSRSGLNTNKGQPAFEMGPSPRDPFGGLPQGAARGGPGGACQRTPYGGVYF